MSSKCGHCGAPLPAGAATVTCVYCGHQSHVAKTPGSEARGALITEADFRGPTVAGWIFDRNPAPDGERLECLGGARPSLRVTLPAGKATAILWLTSSYDDIDITLGVSFATTCSADANVAVRFRAGHGHEGGYGVRLWSDGAWGLNWLEGTAHKEYLGKGTRPNGWLASPGINALRVVANGDRLRVYFGDMLACSVRDDKYKQGMVHVRVAAGDAPLDILITELVLREAR